MIRAGDPVLATGAGGFVGGHVAALLAARGYDVIGVDARPLEEWPAGKGVSAVRLDAADCALLEQVAAGRFAAVAHHAAIVDTTFDDDERLRVENVEKALALAEAARSGGAPFVYASSASVYGRFAAGFAIGEDALAAKGACSGPLNAYARSKLALDDAMSERYSGDDWFWAGLRYSNVFGTGETAKGRMASILHEILRLVACGGAVRLFDDTLDAARDYVPARFVAESIHAMLVRGGRSGLYNMGTGVAVSFRTLLGWCELFSGDGVRLQLVPNPYADTYQYWTCLDTSRWDAAFAGAARFTEAGIRSEAASLYAVLAAAAPPQVPASGG